MNEHTDANTDEHNDVETTSEASRTDGDSTHPGDEFRLIIKKLDMPVRPRGVLAE
jgi:hypothetical protein